MLKLVKSSTGVLFEEVLFICFLVVQMLYSANDIATANNYLADDRIDILILDIHLKDTNGLEFLEKVKVKHPNLEVIMMTGRGDMDTEL